MNEPTPNLVVIEREMRHPPEKIWRALTQGELIKQWLMENDFQPAVGHKFNFRATPAPNWDGVIECKVLVVEPNKQLSYTWTTMGQDFVVAWTLTPTETGTLVRVEQSGFRPEQKANYNGAKYGWQKFMGNLDQVVARMERETVESDKGDTK
jgi:uncharacterized protein YndB with AHSA1/START domain